MKRVPLALAFVIVAGTASAAIFSPPPASTRPDEQPAKIAPAVRPSAPPVVKAVRAPVPLPDLPKPPPLDIASLAEAPPAAVRPAPRPPIPARANAVLGHAAEKEVRVLSDSRCGGRPMKSITVTPDGRVLVGC